MKYLSLSAALIPALYAQEQQATPLPVTAEPDSIECHFAPADASAAPCTLRLHLVPAAGIDIFTRDDSPGATPLQCLDGEGNLLLGRFREWESCYDSTGHCLTMVFDLFTRPKGSSLSVDTQIPIKIVRQAGKPEIAAFDPGRDAELTVAGHPLHIIPNEASAEAKRAGQISFTIEYDDEATVRDLILCTASGKPLTYRVVDDGTAQSKGRSRVTYLIHPGKGGIHLALTPAPTTDTVSVPVRFRAAIGSLDVPGTGK